MKSTCLPWSQSVFYQESIRSSHTCHGVNLDFVRSPSGVHQEFTRSPDGVSGLYQESIRSLPKVHQEYQDFIRTPDGLHQEAWGSVTYRILP